MLQARRLIDFITAAICSVLLLAMVALVAWQVISRYALNDPSTFSEELLRFGVIWLSLIGTAYVAGKSGHMSVDLLKNLLPPRWQDALNILIQFAFIAFAIDVLIVGGMRAVNIAAQQYTAVLQIPMGAIYGSLPVAGVLTLIYSVLNIIDLLLGRSTRTPVGEDFPAGE